MEDPNPVTQPRSGATLLAGAIASIVALGAAGCAGERPGAALADSPHDAADRGRAPTAGPYVRVLGTVQDGGLPHAACACARCEAARTDPSRRRRIASLALCLPASGRVYLVDATPDIREQLRDPCGTGGASAGGVDRAPLDGVFLTHAHLGHYLGLAFFGFEAVHTRDLPLFGTRRMTDFLRNNAPWDQLVRLENVRLRDLEPDSAVVLEDGVRITPFLVPHRDEYTDTVGFAIEGPRRSLLYVPDTDRWSTWKPSLPERLVGIDVAILDGTFYSPEELPGRDVTAIGHPTIETTMELLEPAVRTRALRVSFTHLNHSNPALDPASSAAARVRGNGFAVLQEGQVFAL